MEEQVKQPSEQGSRMKKRLIWTLAILVLASVFLLWSPFGKTEDKEGNHPRSTFNRDEPAKDQVLQEDYEAKIRSMLDSGMSVPEISRQTGIRKDVIRKIKKELGKGDSE